MDAQVDVSSGFTISRIDDATYATSGKCFKNAYKFKMAIEAKIMDLVKE